jgi:S1-C subfamily serine protease
MLSEESELHFTSDCAPGNSGGPVLDSEGKVIGLFNSSTPKDSHLLNDQRSCFAVKANYLQNHTQIPIR